MWFCGHGEVVLNIIRKRIKVSVSKLVKRTNELKYLFGLCLILVGFGNIVTGFHV